MVSMNEFFDDIVQQEHRDFREKEIKLAEYVISRLSKNNTITEGVYIPNPVPKEKAKYIFLTMEPSFGRWAKTLDNAYIMLKKGFKNFLWSHDDMVFHYSINKYLSSSYYITDISKIAMKIDNANDVRKDVYPLWIQHLLEEIKLFGTQDYMVFFVGNQVEMWLKDYIEEVHIAGTVTHFSILAASKRNQIALQYKSEYDDFLLSHSPNEEMVSNFTKKLLENSLCNSVLIDEIYTRIAGHKTFMNETRIKLAFSYYMAFKLLVKSELVIA